MIKRINEPIDSFGVCVVIRFGTNHTLFFQSPLQLFVFRNRYRIAEH